MMNDYLCNNCFNIMNTKYGHIHDLTKLEQGLAWVPVAWYSMLLNQGFCNSCTAAVQALKEAASA